MSFRLEQHTRTMIRVYENGHIFGHLHAAGRDEWRFEAWSLKTRGQRKPYRLVIALKKATGLPLSEVRTMIEGLGR